jgi:hypothetical protein
MKHAKWLLPLVLLAALMLVLAACGGSTEPTSPPAAEPTTVSEAKPTDAPASEPTQAPEPTTPPTDTPLPEPTEPPAVEEEDVFDSSSLSSTTDLSSYRSTMRITMVTDNNGQEEQQTLEFSVEYTSEPKAQHISMTGAALASLDDESEQGTIEMYLIEDTMYMLMGDQWMSLPATEEDLDTDAMITPDSLLDDLCGWKKEGREEIDGVDVQHWSFTKEDYDKCALTAGLLGIGELTDAGGDLYVAEDDNYVALMDLFYEGENLDLGLGQADEGVTAHRMEIHYEMSDVNEPFTIEAPAEALESSALPEDIPVPDGTTGVNNMFGMINYTSDMSPDELYQFYQDEMPSNGWTEESAEAMAGLWMLEYSKDGKTASIMISEDDSGEASVLITVNEG